MTAAKWFLLLLATEAIRLAVAANHPLFETEAYYWLWSQHPAWGYFDHPPMLSWVIWLTDFWGSPHALAARFHCVIAHFLVSVMLYGLGRNLFGSDRIGFLTALIFNVVPVNSLMATQNQPDVPLVLFWMMALYCFERALATERRRWWLLVGLAAGAALLSKFHALFFGGSLLLYLVTSRQDRHWLATRWPWIALAIALLVYSPNFIWNARHDWITYDFQLLRPTDEKEFRLLNVAAVLLEPFAYLTPWVCLIFIIAAWTAYRFGVRQHHRGWALCFWASVPLLAFFLMVSFRTRVKLHWPAAGFIALCPAVAALINQWQPRWRRLFLAIPIVFCALAYAYLLHPMPLSQKLPNSWIPKSFRLDPEEPLTQDYASRLFGWRELGQWLGPEMARMENRAPAYIMARRFDLAATAAFWAGRPQLAFVMDPGPNYRFDSHEPDPRSFLTWQQTMPKGASAIYLRGKKGVGRWMQEIESLKPHFETISEPFCVEVQYKGYTWRRWDMVRCEGWRGL